MWRAWIAVIAGLLGPPPLRISVNIPAYRLEVYIADSLSRTIPIAVGMPRFPTPRGEFAITSVDWNPWWIPPDHPWSAKERPTRPRPKNPIGRVKLTFRPLYFLHGSPFAASIGSAASHGCIRLRNEDAVALARLVHQFGSPALLDGDIDLIAADTATRTITLEIPIPLEIRYDLVEVRAGRLSAYRDIYHIATRSLRDDVYAALAAHGVSGSLVDSARVAAFVRKVGAQGATIPVDSLSRRDQPARRAMTGSTRVARRAGT